MEDKETTLNHNRVLSRAEYYATLDVDHIIPNPADNALQNLQPLTRKMHLKKTLTDNPKKILKGLHRKVVAIKLLTRIRPHTGKFDSKYVEVIREEERIQCMSFKEAVNITGCRSASITQCVRGRLKKTRSLNTPIWWSFSTENLDDDLPDEEWRKIPEKWFGFEKHVAVFVSSHGRVQTNRDDKKGRKSDKIFGTLSSGGYRVKKIHGKTLCVHRLVFATFHDEEMEDLYRKSDTSLFHADWFRKFQIHHKDENRENNCLENLRFVTPQEHARITNNSDNRKERETIPIRGRKLKIVNHEPTPTEQCVACITQNVGNQSHTCHKKRTRTQVDENNPWINFSGARDVKTRLQVRESLTGISRVARGNRPRVQTLGGEYWELQYMKETFFHEEKWKKLEQTWFLQKVVKDLDKSMLPGPNDPKRGKHGKLYIGTSASKKNMQKNNSSGYANIQVQKYEGRETSWTVVVSGYPQKNFHFSKNGSREKALLLALEYRDSLLSHKQSIKTRIFLATVTIQRIFRHYFYKKLAETNRYYWISNKGRVRKPDGRITDGCPNAGYKNIEILGHKFKIHRLVIAAFKNDILEAMYQDYLTSLGKKGDFSRI